MNVLFNLNKYKFCSDFTKYHHNFHTVMNVIIGKILYNISCVSEYILSNEIYNSFVVVVILASAVMSGLQTYNEFSNNITIDIAEYAVFATFCLEFFLKLLSEGDRPYLYFIGKNWTWNNFDFLILISSMPFVWKGMFALRLLRIFRLAKIIQKVRNFQIIMSALVLGLQCSFYVTILIGFVFYFYAIAGVYYFRENDPFHYGSFPITFLTLFRILTMDAWAELFLINAVGCDHYYASVYVTPDMETPFNSIYWCHNSTPNPVISTLYFFSLIMIAVFVFLSIFIAVITMGMEQALDEIKQDVEERRRAAVAERKRRILLNLSSSKLHSPHGALQSSMKVKRYASPVPSPAPTSTSPPLLLTDSTLRHTNETSLERIRVTSHVESNGYLDDLDRMVAERKVRHRNSNGNVPLEDTVKLSTWDKIWNNINTSRMLPLGYIHRMEARDRAIQMRNLIRGGLGMKLLLDCDESSYITFNQFSLACRQLVQHRYFNRFMLGCIFAAAISMGIDSDLRMRRNSAAIKAAAIMDNFALAMFTVEIGLKILAEGKLPWRYFSDSWNIFDFVVVLVSYVQSASFTTVLRLARLLRLLKMVRSLSRLRVIVEALALSFSSMFYISVIAFFVYFIFALFGTSFFSENDPFYFANLHVAIIGLFYISTLYNWSEVVYCNYYGCDVFGGVYDRSSFTCQHPKASGALSPFYFIVFTIIARFVVLTLFLGLITANMEKAIQEMAREEREEKEIRELCYVLELGGHQMTCLRELFAMLDVHGGGTIDEMELKLGLEIIGDDISPGRVEQLMLKARESEEGINVASFVEILCDDPMRRRKIRNIAGLSVSRLDLLNLGGFSSPDISEHNQKNIENQLYELYKERAMTDLGEYTDDLDEALQRLARNRSSQQKLLVDSPDAQCKRSDSVASEGWHPKYPLMM